MTSLFIVISIFLAVAIGYKTKLNTGFLAICFAYLLGCFLVGMSPKEVIAKWPVSTFFVILSVSLFYNFALVNGTLEKVALHLIYACRSFTRLLPFVLFFSSGVIAALGAGYFTVLAFMAPITLMLCDKIKMNKLVGAVAVNCGALVGANFMTSASGIIFRGLMATAGYESQQFAYSINIFISTFTYSVLIIGLFLFIPKGNRGIGKDLTIEKPEAFDKKQKTNLTLILVMIAIVLLPPIMRIFMPGSELIILLNSKIDVGLIAIFMSVIALLLGLADEKAVVAKVPWNTIIMICGVGMLIGVAIEAGTLDLMSQWIGNNIPAPVVPLALAVVAGIMSFFSSTLGVVCPALFPLVPGLSSVTGIDPMVMFTCIVVGSQSSAISPFSSGGSLVLGSCASEEDRAKLFPQLLFVGVPCCYCFAMLVSFVISVILAN